MRTLEDIIPPSRRKDIIQLGKSTEQELSNYPNKMPKFPYATLLSASLVVALSIGALFYFSSAKVEVTPNTVSAAVQNSFTASKSSGALPYEIITAQKIASRSVAINGTKTVTSSASGTITIYNTQSRAQTLIANTRFATSAGLIFRIRSSITIPSGSQAKPGSITAKVYADKPGDSYNIGPASFTIPGFAGTPQASQVYARSNASMTGGASGSVPIVDAVVEKETRTALKTALNQDLIASLETEIPEGYLLLQGSTKIVYEEITLASSSTTGMADVKEQGTITAIVFPNAALAEAIATSIGGLGYQGEPLSLANTKDLELVATDDIPTPDAQSFLFTLSGTAQLVYTVDPTRIAAAISGKTRAAAEVALTNYPEVKRAVIILRPFWRKAFPQDPASISVVVANP